MLTQKIDKKTNAFEKFRQKASFFQFTNISTFRGQRGGIIPPLKHLNGHSLSFILIFIQGKKKKTEMRKLIFDHLVFSSHLAMLSDLRAVGELYQDPSFCHRKPAFYYGPGQPHFPALIIHQPMSLGESERAS